MDGQKRSMDGQKRLLNMNLTNLHPDIIASESESGRLDFIVEVINPSAGIWGGPLKDELVTLIYVCKCAYGPVGVHKHSALYGPKVIAFDDTCKICGRIEMWCGKNAEWMTETVEPHEYTPYGIEILDKEHFSLYAD